MGFSLKQKKIIESKENKIIVLAVAAAGKALENGSIIYTVDGPIKIEQANIGQKIYGEDGKLHNIVGVYPQGKKKKYIVQFSDGTEINCCEDHLWTFQTEAQRSHKSKKWITASLKEIIDKYPLFIDARAKNNFGINNTKRKNIFVPMTAPIEFSSKELPLQPYLLGALLGDGTIGGRGKQNKFTNEDSDVLEKVDNQLHKIGYALKHIKNYDYSICQNEDRKKTGKLTLILEELKLDFTNSENKFIPNIYKYSSIEDRIELLKGIIDTDGYCEGSSYDLILKSKQLILDVQEVCESLGLTATYQEKRAICTNASNGVKDCGIVYRLRIKTSKLIPKLHSSQKREKQWKPAKVYSHRAIINIIETNEEVEMTCIKVDNPTALFVTNHFIVTHNTAILVERVKTMLSRGCAPEKMVVITFTTAAASEMSRRIGHVDGLFIGTIHAYAFYLLCAGGYHEQANKYVDEEKFDMLFTLIQRHPECIKPVEYLVVDEAQDVSENEWEFFDMLAPDGFFMVGDERQCQPEGTEVYLRNGIRKKIEDIQIGDSVVWYDNSKGHCCALSNKHYNALNKIVLNKSQRLYNNDFLITVKTEEGLKSTYTANHRTFIKMRIDTEYKHLVYLMCNDDYRFRVGKILIRGTETKNGNPWRIKMTEEGCTKIWILKVFKDEKEARVYEQKISYKYQIPQICWQQDKVRWTTEDINYIYEGLDTYSSAKKCLFDHKLSIEYPIIDRNQLWLFDQKFAFNAVSQLYAINIIPEIMDCVVYNGTRKKEYRHISCEKQYITEPINVYSLEVEGGTYVADGIITHNCIYTWRDVNIDDFKNRQNVNGTIVYELNENYRNSRDILNYAKWIISKTSDSPPDESMCMRGTRGTVDRIELNYEELVNIISESGTYDWFVLTRTNDQIAQVQYILDKYKIPNLTFKRGGKNFDELNELLHEPKVKVLTIHTAKGLECDNVIVIGANMWKDEEIRLSYVAATRARDHLIWMTQPKKKKGYFKAW